MNRLEYYEISDKAYALVKEKHSKFIAYAYPVYSEQEVQDCLALLKKEYRDARHHCYAYVLGSGYEISKESDDGEPSGSAGLPILLQLQSFNLTNTLVVIVRYFGGIKLGVGGLRQAYKLATREAIESVSIKTLYIREPLSLTCPMELIRHYYQIREKFNIKIISEEVNGQLMTAQWHVAKKDLEACREQLQAASHRIELS